MTQKKQCPQCGADLDQTASEGLCPKCSLSQEGETSADSMPTLQDAPKGATSAGMTSQDPGLKTPSRLRYFGDYEILDEIARGGMGIVYRARQISLNRMVAVKVILSGELATEKDVQRFKREAEAAANLKHPNIVAIHETGYHEHHYFSMDYVAGRDLAERIRQGPLYPHEAARLLKKISEAVAYAHMQGTLHRDLKPSNILLDQTGEPHITDFGLAKQMDQANGMTLSGAVLGTPSYMAPEQAEGQLARVTERTDVYGLGAILFSLLTGKPPFNRETPLATMRQVVEDRPSPPSQFNANVPRELEIICLKCLEKNPQNRYGSAGELAADLNRFLRGQPIAARPMPKFYRALDHVRQRPWLVSGILSLLILWLGIGLFSTWQYSELMRWKAEHPGERVQPVQLLELVGLSAEAHLGWAASVYISAIILPIMLFLGFAALKQKRKLSPGAVAWFGTAAVGALLFAVLVLMGGAYATIRSATTPADNVIALMLMLTPGFWFAAHLISLVSLEWRARRFGERSEEVQLIYGTTNSDPSPLQKASRMDYNLYLALACAAYMGAFLIEQGSARMIYWVLWMLLFGTTFLYVEREVLLKWARSSKVSSHLFGFLALAIVIWLVAGALGLVEQASRQPGALAESALIISAATALFFLGRQKLSLRPSPPSWWENSTLSQWLGRSHNRKEGFYLIAAMLLILPGAGSVHWAIVACLAFLLAGDLLEICIDGRGQRRLHLGVTLGIACFWLTVIAAVERPFEWRPAFVFGLFLGFLTTGAHLLGMPGHRHSHNRSWLLWAMALLLMLAFNIHSIELGGRLISRFNLFYQLNNARATISMVPRSILQGHGEVLAHAYENLGLSKEGIEYLQQLESTFPKESPEAFQLRWWIAQLDDSATGKEAANQRYQDLAADFFLIPAQHWQVLGPFAADAARFTSTSDARPIMDGHDSKWQSGALFAQEFPACLNFNSQRRSPPADQIAFARLQFRSKANTEAKFCFAFGGDAKVWLNDDQLLRAKHRAAYALDNATVLGTLRTGDNELLVQLSSREKAFGFMFRLMNPDGTQPVLVQF